LDSFLQASIPAERLQAIQENPLSTMSPEDQRGVRMAMGWHLMNEIYRQLLLSVISELWVDYLTQVESLRVSIGLEAYAQRDPLVQYKGKASELFSKLLSDIRTGVISRMFVYRPRVAGSVQLERGKEEEAQHVPSNVKQEASHAQAAPAGGTMPDTKQPVDTPRPSNQPDGDRQGSGSRRKRHRH
jgi:preprotein translocase subunit SecA